MQTNDADKIKELLNKAVSGLVGICVVIIIFFTFIYPLILWIVKILKGGTKLIFIF